MPHHPLRHQRKPRLSIPTRKERGMTKAKRIFHRITSPLAAVLMLALLWQFFAPTALAMTDAVSEEEISCTSEHPFYSPVKFWTAACQLRAGNILVTLHGEYVIVEWEQHEILESPITVYNFEVADFHTYYVGENNGVLVHNTCGPSRGVGNKGWVGDKTWRENVQL